MKNDRQEGSGTIGIASWQLNVMIRGKLTLTGEDPRMKGCRPLTEAEVDLAQQSFGGVYAEAWALGIPVIAADTPATRELIAPGQDGLLVSQDARSIADAITLLLDDQFLAAKMGQRGREKVHEQFRWPIVAQRVAAAYQSLTSLHACVAEV